MQQLYSLLLLSAIYFSGFSQTNILDSIQLLKRNAEEAPLIDKKGYLKQALKLAVEDNLWEEQTTLLFNLARSETKLANFSAALEYVEKVDNLIQAHQLIQLNGRKWMEKGDVFLMMRNWEAAYQEYEQAAIFFATQNDSIRLGTAYNGIGATSYFTNRKEQALGYLEKALAILEKQQAEEELLACITNLVAYFLFENQPNKALSYAESSLKINQKTGNKSGEAEIFGNIAYAHSLLKNYEKAFIYYEKCIAIAKKEGFKQVEYIAYLDMSDTYEAMGDFENAFDTYKTYQLLKDEVQNVDVKKKMAEMQVKYETERKSLTIKELEQQAKIEQQQRWLLIGGILASAIISVLVYLKSKSDLQQEKTKQRLIQSKLLAKTAQEERLKDKLAHKNKDLTNLSLDIVRKNDFSIALKQRLDIIEKKLPDTLKNELKDLQLFTDSHLRTNEDLVTLQTNVEQVNEEFYKQLDKLVPDLNQAEKQLCGLLRLNLSSKEVAVIRNITPKSAKMARYRLRKRFGLQAEEDIVSFLQQV